MPISHAHIGHVALCLCLQSRTVEAGLNAQNTALYQHQKWNDKINTNNKCGNPKKCFLFFGLCNISCQTRLERIGQPGRWQRVSRVLLVCMDARKTESHSSQRIPAKDLNLARQLHVFKSQFATPYLSTVPVSLSQHDLCHFTHVQKCTYFLSPIQLRKKNVNV